MLINGKLIIKDRLRPERFPFQENVIDRQEDNTLDPGASPTLGDRYLMENAASLHANFGTITGLGDDDIVEFDGTDFQIVWDASVNGEGGLLWVEDENVWYEFDGVSWSKQNATVSANAPISGDGSSSSPLDISAGGIDTAELADNAVTTAKIADSNVTLAKLATDSVDASKIASGAVGSDELATDSVITAKILDANVTAGKLASDSVTTAKILDANVTSGKLASDSVTTAKILDANVTAAKLASDSVTTAKILDANVTAGKLASDSVTTAKILDSNVTAGKLANDAVTTAKILDANITGAKLAADSVGDTNLDYSGTALRCSVTAWDGTTTKNINHGFGADVMVEVVDSTGETILIDSVKRTDTNNVDLTSSSAASNYKVFVREVATKS